MHTHRHTFKKKKKHDTHNALCHARRWMCALSHIESDTHQNTHIHTHSPRTTNITSWDIRRRVALPLNVPDPWRPCLLSTSCLSKSSPRYGLLFISLLLASLGLNGGSTQKAIQTHLNLTNLLDCSPNYTQKYVCFTKRYTKMTCHSLSCARWQIYVFSCILTILVLLLWELLHFLGHGVQEDKSHVYLCVHKAFDRAQNRNKIPSRLPDVGHNSPSGEGDFTGNCTSLFC